MNRFNSTAISSFSAKSCNAPGQLGMSNAENREAVEQIQVKTTLNGGDSIRHLKN